MDGNAVQRELGIGALGQAAGAVLLGARYVIISVGGVIIQEVQAFMPLAAVRAVCGELESAGGAGFLRRQHQAFTRAVIDDAGGQAEGFIGVDGIADVSQRAALGKGQRAAVAFRGEVSAGSGTELQRQCTALERGARSLTGGNRFFSAGQTGDIKRIVAQGCVIGGRQRCHFGVRAGGCIAVELGRRQGLGAIRKRGQDTFQRAKRADRGLHGGLLGLKAGQRNPLHGHQLGQHGGKIDA